MGAEFPVAFFLFKSNHRPIRGEGRENENLEKKPLKALVLTPFQVNQFWNPKSLAFRKKPFHMAWPA